MMHDELSDADTGTTDPATEVPMGDVQPDKPDVPKTPGEYAPDATPANPPSEKA